MIGTTLFSISALDYGYFFAARILVRTDRPAEALALLAGPLESAKANDRGRNRLSICLLTALAHSALRDREKAFHLLGEGLEFAQAQGHQHTLIEEGELIKLLKKQKMPLLI